MEQAVPGWIERIGKSLSARDRPQRGELQLSRRRVYILPAKAGLLFAAVLLTMLLTAINYMLPMGYALTFLLTGIGLVAMLHTWRNLIGITLRPGRVDAVHAGELAEFSLMLHNRAGPDRFAIRIEVPDTAQTTLVDLAPRAEQLVAIALPTTRRGWLPVPRLKVSSTFPLGLWRTWAWWHPATRVLVYPRPETPAVPLPISGATVGQALGTAMGDEDFSALRPFRDGDPTSRIAWKAVARSGGDALLTIQFDGGPAGDVWLDWQATPIGMDDEARLSRLTRWVLDADEAGVRYGLRLPKRTLDISSGPIHKTECLEALALMDV
jgi:uncharacterized protein (DUF58 family)